MAFLVTMSAPQGIVPRARPVPQQIVLPCCQVAHARRQRGVTGRRSDAAPMRAIADQSLCTSSDREEIASPGFVVRAAENTSELRAAAVLRADAFYDDLQDRQKLPFPKRFLPTFSREFAERELSSLTERTTRAVDGTYVCHCLVAVTDEGEVAGCLVRWLTTCHYARATSDVSLKAGPCYSHINGVCIAEGEAYAYIDNVSVAPESRRRRVATALLAAACRVACTEYNSKELFTHVHYQNYGARKLYARHGFVAPPLAESRQDSFDRATDRMGGLLLLQAPVPLRARPIAQGDCRCGGMEFVFECVCDVAR